jgi:alkylation response protein AidB-like acyl-CoA dehydrogenase
VARVEGRVDEREGLVLLLVPASGQGITVTRLSVVDGRNVARVRFEEVAANAVLGEPGRGAELLEPVLDRARIGLAAEMLGGLLETFERTVAYLKERQQFGVAIGSFQALKHRAARLYAETELCRSIVLEALRAVDEERADVPLLASAAKARLSDAFIQIANEAIQLHGGIGVTDDLDIGFYLKRARVAEMTLGDGAFHRDRFARLKGY